MINARRSARRRPAIDTTEVQIVALLLFLFLAMLGLMPVSSQAEAVCSSDGFDCPRLL